MRRALYLIIAVGLICGASTKSFAAGCSSTAYTGYTCVSHAGSFSTSATTRNQTISVTAGDAVTFFGQALSTGAALTLTDSGACTGTLVGASTTAPTTPAIDIGAVTKATSTGTCTITMHWAGSATTLVSSVQDWQGWNGAIDVYGAISSTTGTGTRPCPAVTTVQNGDLILCMMGDTGNNSGTFTAGSGFAITLGNNSMSQEAEVQATAASITPGFTYSQSSTFGVITFALESSSVPPPASNALSAWNGIVPTSIVGGLNRINGQYINPSTGFIGSINGAATPFTAFPVTEFVNFSGGTNGSEPATTDLNNSTFGTSGFAWVTTEIAAGMTYSNGTTFGSLPEPVLAGTTAYSSSGPLSWECTSSTNAAGTATSCGSATLSIPGATNSVSAGFWYTTPNCNAGGTQDCGALGITSGGTDYVNIHVNGTGGNCSQNGLFLEGHGGNSVGCLPFTNGAIYRINGQENNGATALTVTFSNGSAVISATNALAANEAIKLTTTGTLPTNFTVGISSGTYTSGITATGSIGQTCLLSSFNGSGSGATGVLYLNGTNTISGGNGISWTNFGSGYTSAPTSATAASGTATCSGTATIATVLATPILFVSPTGLSTSQFELVSAQGGTPIVAGSAGSGTHTATQYDVLTVCQVINGNLVLLGNLYALASTAAQAPSLMQTGVSGEGPTVTGYNFYWGGYFADGAGKISLTECY
jgi:hypothetical protein